MKSRRPTRLWPRVALRLAVSAAALAVMFAIIPFRDVVDALRRLPLAVGVLALGTYLALHLIGIVKWRMLMNAAGAELGFAAAARCYYFGLYGNTFLPSIVGGDVVRAGLALRLSTSSGGVLFGSLIDRTLDVAGLALLAAIGALMVPTALPAASRAVFTGLAWLAVAGGVAVAIAIFALPARRLPMKARRVMARLRRAVRALGKRPIVVVWALLLGMLLQALLVVLNWQLGRAIGIDISLVVWMFVWPLAKIAALVPITQGGIGVREAAQVALFQPFGVAAPEAMATGLVFQAIILSGGLLGGGIAALLATTAREAAPA